MDMAPAPTDHVIDIAGQAGRLLTCVRAERTRVHAITNAAAQVLTANVLLAAGAIPSLTTAADEVPSFVSRAGALLVNLGTLDGERRELGRVAAQDRGLAGQAEVREMEAAR